MSFPEVFNGNMKTRCNGSFVPDDELSRHTFKRIESVYYLHSRRWVTYLMILRVSNVTLKKSNSVFVGRKHSAKDSRDEYFCIDFISPELIFSLLDGWKSTSLKITSDGILFSLLRYESLTFSEFILLVSLLNETTPSGGAVSEKNHGINFRLAFEPSAGEDWYLIDGSSRAKLDSPLPPPPRTDISYLKYLLRGDTSALGLDCTFLRASGCGPLFCLGNRLKFLESSLPPLYCWVQ